MFRVKYNRASYEPPIYSPNLKSIKHCYWWYYNKPVDYYKSVVIEQFYDNCWQEIKQIY